MKFTQLIARQLRDVHFGGNWTAVNLREKLADVGWQEATARIDSLHSIATLVFHTNYFVKATIDVLRGKPLNAKDKFSFDCPPILSEQDWKRLLKETWADAEQLASLIEQMEDRQLAESFAGEVHGTNFRCLQGLVEHCHYHLGQIAVIKSILRHGKK
jgi:hypothetical protein